MKLIFLLTKFEMNCFFIYILYYKRIYNTFKIMIINNNLKINIIN